jgi:hypothetical protein
MYSPRYKFPTEKNKVRSSIGIKRRTVIILIDSTLISTTDFDVIVGDWERTVLILLS